MKESKLFRVVRDGNMICVVDDLNQKYAVMFDQSLANAVCGFAEDVWDTDGCLMMSYINFLENKR